MPRRLKNIRRWKGNFQAYTEIHGKTHARSFPLSTPVDEMRAWIAKTKGTFTPPVDVRGSFAEDITEYLSRITALPTYQQKAAHLELWARALGRDRPRRTLTATELDAVMQLWLTTPSRPAPGQRGRPSGPRGIDPQTVRKRRTSLLSLFVTLDGKDAANPVRATKNPTPPAAEVRGTDYATITRILAAMPESLTKRRVDVLAYTGLPPGLLAAVQPGDVNLTHATVRVAPRRKGHGIEARTLPLTAHGVAAFRRFHRAHAYGRFAVQNTNISFQRACRRVGVNRLTLYDLRHSFGAQMYRATKDLPTVARFLLHAEGSTQTARYAKAANEEVDRAAALAFAGSLTAHGISGHCDARDHIRRP